MSIFAARCEKSRNDGRGSARYSPPRANCVRRIRYDLSVRSLAYKLGMRIYFVGSHATGKTTLCRYVSRRFGLPMISEVARAILAEMETSLDALRTDMDLVAEYQRRVFARQMAIEHQHQHNFVSDRAFDNVAYAAEHTHIVADMMGNAAFFDYMRWVSDGIVFFLRPHPALLKEDGVRAGVSWDSVLRIDGMIKLMLEQYRVDYLPIESVSMQERVRAVEFVLARAGLAAAKRQPMGQFPFGQPPAKPVGDNAVENAPTGQAPAPLAAPAGSTAAAHKHGVVSVDAWPYALTPQQRA